LRAIFVALAEADSCAGDFRGSGFDGFEVRAVFAFTLKTVRFVPSGFRFER
jgi:hypothetical protein